MSHEDLSRYPVRFVTKRWPHHSTHSGYDRLVHYIGSAIEPLDLSRLSSRWIPERVAVRFCRRAGVRGYFTPSFYSEWAAAREMMVRPRKTVYHLLYGDDTYRYLGSLRRLRGHRLVVSYHVPPDDLAQRLRYVEHLRQADAIVVVGTNQIPFFAASCGQERVHYIPHGVDTEVFSPAATTAGVPERARRVLFVGSHRRDFTTLDDVIRQVGRLAPTVKFVLVTDPRVGGAFRRHGNVELRSHVSEPDLIRLYRESAVVVQPMVQSTANNSVLEALACGTPVVATDVGGVRDYAHEGCAVLTAPGNAAAMVDAVMTITQDSDTRHRMGHAARRHAKQFAWPEIASRLVRLYQSVM